MAYHDMRAKIQAARERFRRGEAVERGSVRAEILESWERSRAYGLEFSKADKRLISPGALRERIRERRELCAVAVPVMEKLYDYTAGSGCLCSLSDEDGYMLKAMGDDEIMVLAKANKFMEGCNRSERRLGTNGIGTPLVTHKPIQVFAEEHYYELHYNWVCSGAPIFDPTGRPLGVFCVTGLIERVSFHTLGMVAAAAASISQQIAMKQAYDIVDRMQQRARVIVETVPSGILLCNSELEVIQINSRASSLLMLPEMQVVGKKLHAILGWESLERSRIQEAIDDKVITIKRDGKNLHLIFSLNASNTDEYVITFMKTEALHRKIHRIIGSEAFFTFADIIGAAPALQNAVSLAKIAATNKSTVLLTGESGTGKELFAQSIHNGGSRGKGPFVVLNCAALPKSLVESELFGYESGAFTGARKEGSVGKFELANGGTIFLDEIGDMPLDVQASLLRVLQNREVSRIGSSKAIPIDVRVIAASNRNLPAAIESDIFRADLYYRLNVFNIHIPPLRERIADIRPLAEYFLRKYADLAARPVRGFAEEAYRVLEGRPWRGNVRELENVVERAVYVARGAMIAAEDLHLQDPSTAREEYRPPQREVPEKNGRGAEQHGAAALYPLLAAELRSERAADAVAKAIRLAGGNMRKAAAILGVSRRTLYRKVDRLQADLALLRRAGTACAGLSGENG